jgi:hypothetical protein
MPDDPSEPIPSPTRGGKETHRGYHQSAAVDIRSVPAGGAGHRCGRLQWGSRWRRHWAGALVARALPAP